MKFVNQTFVDDRIRLDFNEFAGCQFASCSVVFGGFGPTSVHDCQFDDACRFELDGAAQLTVQYLDAMHSSDIGPGRRFVERLLEAIRRTGFISRSLRGTQPEREPQEDGADGTVAQVASMRQQNPHPRQQ